MSIEPEMRKFLGTRLCFNSRDEELKIRDYIRNQEQLDRASGLNISYKVRPLIENDLIGEE